MSAAGPHDRLNMTPPLLDPVHTKIYGETSYGATNTADSASIPNSLHTAYPLTQPVQRAQQPQPTRFHEDFDASQRGSSIFDGANAIYHSEAYTPSRGGTLKKKGSLKKKSLRGKSSRRNSRAGSVTSLLLGEKERYADGEGAERDSAFYTPVPTSGSPTEILANRFQDGAAWRKVLKDLTIYFREIQSSHEARSKSLLKLSNLSNNMEYPTALHSEGGYSDTIHILRDFHRQAFAEANKARDIQTGVIDQLTGLRNDLGLKIKEIKNLAGDFKNSVEKEMDATKKAVAGLQDALGVMDSGLGQTSGKGDPFIVKLAVDRQVERQINEENYLHTALLNLEASGRELESIVVGEIQKAHDSYAGILKHEADEIYETLDKLRSGPLSLPKDYEWNKFVESDDHFIDPRLPMRRAEDIEYPGRYHPAASEVRAGMLERKSKYLKSYTPGWYILSPSHLHEFKSHERLNDQSPVMSLYLPEQKLGSHSQPFSSSHKFMIKGRQTGAIHSRHSWVFRAESHDTMLAWYEDIKKLTEINTRAERNAFVTSHRRTLSAASQRAGSVSSDGLDEDEADQVPYSAGSSSVSQAAKETLPPRPQPGGRFPSELQVDHSLQAPPSASSGESLHDYEVVAAAGTTFPYRGGHQSYDAYAAYEPEHPGREMRGTDSPTLFQETNHIDNSADGDWVGPTPGMVTAGGTADILGSRESRTPLPPKQSMQRDQPPTTASTSRPQSRVMGPPPAPVIASTAAVISTDDSSAGYHRPAMATSNQSLESHGNTAPTTVSQTAKPTRFVNPQPRDPINNAPTPPAGEAAPGTSRSSKSVTSISDLHVPGEYPPTPVTA
ncbi:MAG: hypothetical protein M1839_009406 [Geoglossum umbratile]|nr:MAG: hypothetical protein M1839_009406 [Geoglossum umbratile]